MPTPYPTVIPIIARHGPFPSNMEPSPSRFSSAFRQRLGIDIDGSKVLLGSTADSKPTKNVGPWLHNGSWQVWNDSIADYVPVSLQFSTNSFPYLSASLFTADRNTLLPDTSGTVALLLDIYVPRATVYLANSADTPLSNVDWLQGNTFWLNLSANATVTFTNAAEGMEIALKVTNTGNDYTVAWPTGVRWPGGTAPVVPASAAGIESSTLYVFRCLSSTLVAGGSLLYYGTGSVGFTSAPVSDPSAGGTQNAAPGYGRTGIGYGTFGSPADSKTYNEP